MLIDEASMIQELTLLEIDAAAQRLVLQLRRCGEAGAVAAGLLAGLFVVRSHVLVLAC